MPRYPWAGSQLWAALNGLIAIAVVSYAAHGAAAVLLLRAVGWLETGTRLQLMYAVLLIALTLIAPPGPWVRGVGLAIAAGLLLFPGVLYGMSFGGPRWLGAVAPLGGLAWLLGWGSLAVHGLRKR
jgi:uncharacterized membrane protein YgdD (TMEM256/DUF423 family)